jgi:ribonuclease Y
VALVALLVGAGAGYLVRKASAEAALGSAEAQARQVVEAAQREAEGKQREMLVEAREEVQRLRGEFDREMRDQRGEQQRLEKRLLQR